MQNHNGESQSELEALCATGERRPVVLVIDRDCEQSGYSTVLRNAGYDVISARDASTACTDAARLLPALIIARFGEPLADALFLCRSLRADEETRNTPILALTRRDDLYTREQILRSGATAISVEPFRRSLLVRQVRRVLARSTLRRVRSLAGRRKVL